MSRNYTRRLSTQYLVTSEPRLSSPHQTYHPLPCFCSHPMLILAVFLFYFFSHTVSYLYNVPRLYSRQSTPVIGVVGKYLGYYLPITIQPPLFTYRRFALFCFCCFCTHLPATVPNFRWPLNLIHSFFNCYFEGPKPLGSSRVDLGQVQS